MSAPSNPPEALRVVRFGLVGLLNSVLGYSVIVIMLRSGAGDIAANVAGYAVGLTVGFALNMRWTFGRSGCEPAAIARYGLAFLIAYAVNLVVIAGAGQLGLVENPLVHLAGMVVYSGTLYLLASRLVFAPGTNGQSARSPHGPYASFAARWPGLAVCALWILLYALMFDLPVSHDVVWQMWIARQLSHGATLYVDILEINPPLWFWLAVPVERIAGFLGVPSVHALIAAVFLQIGFAIALLSRLIPDMTDSRRCAVLAAALVALVIVPLPDFAQREHLALIGALPYLALVSKRSGGVSVSWPLAIAIGAFAAPAFALKHYFLLVPLLLELWLLIRTRRAWSPFRPEIIVLVVAAGLYAAAVFAFAPGFLEVIVPMVRVAYDGYEASLAFQIGNLWVALWIVAGFAIWCYRGSLDALSTASLIAAAAFCLSYFLQQKGWRYHGAPVSSSLFFALTLLLTRMPAGRARLIPGWPVAPAALLIVVHSLQLGPYSNRHAERMGLLLADLEPGEPVLMLAANPSRIWPAVEDLGLTWPSRHFAFWMTNAFHFAQADGSPLSGELDALARDVRTQTVEDIACNPPAVILVDSFARSPARDFDIVTFFELNADFKELFARYTVSETLARFTSYRLSGPWTDPRPEGCRTIF